MFSELYGLNEESPSEIIEKFYENRKFLSLDHPSLQERHQQQILNSVKMEEFYEECELNSLLPYNEAVVRACRKACMYMLYAIRYNQPFGKMNLQHVRVVQGFVGYTPHSWLILDDTYIIDLTLAQFTNIVIPKLAILHKDDAKDLYNESSRHTWIEWTEIENEQIDIPI